VNWRSAPESNRPTVRYYERRGLLKAAYRSGNGYHYYDRDALERLHFTRRAKELGFTLAEIGEFLELRHHPGNSGSAEIRKFTEAKIGNIQKRIRDLRQMEETLRELVTLCDRKMPSGECPILRALEIEERK